jgi:hypothetical protein
MPDLKNCILYSLLTRIELLLITTDIVVEDGLAKRNSVALLPNFSSRLEIRYYF